MMQPAELTIGAWRIFCNNCNRETNHICKLNVYDSSTLLDDEGVDDPNVIPVRLVDGYRLWICAGCDAWTIEKYNAIMPDGEDSLLIDRNYVDSTFIPERTRFHTQLKKYHQLPSTLNGIYREVLHSYNSGLPILCAVGIRMLLEGICEDQEIRGGNLFQKIEGLSAARLPKNIVNNLHSLRFLGNEAAHELIKPDPVELQLAINLAEDLLNFLYELDYRASSLTEWRRKKGKIDKKPPTQPGEDTENLTSDSENE